VVRLIGEAGVLDAAWMARGVIDVDDELEVTG